MISSGVALFFFPVRSLDRALYLVFVFFFNSISRWLKILGLSVFLAIVVLGVLVLGLTADLFPSLERVELVFNFDLELVFTRVFFFLGEAEASSWIVWTLARLFFLLMDGVFYKLYLYRALLLGFIKDLISAWEAIYFDGIELTFFLPFLSDVLGTISS